MIDVDYVSGNIELIAPSSTFFYESSYPYTEKNLHSRTIDKIRYYTDHVHPNEIGYGQIADSIYFNLLNNFF